MHSIFESLFSSSSFFFLFQKNVCVCVCWVVDDAKTLVFLFLFLLCVYRNSGTGGERQSAARKAKSDCLGSKPDLTIPVRLTSITKPDRSVSNVFCCPARQINPDQCLFRKLMKDSRDSELEKKEKKRVHTVYDVHRDFDLKLRII